MTISKAAQELGRKGGQAKSPAKTAAARANAKKPRGKWVTAVSYHAAKDGVEYRGLFIDKGKHASALALTRWHLADEHGVFPPYALLHVICKSLKV